MSGASRHTITGVDRNRILVGDAARMLLSLPDACVDTVTTSPPYHLLRRYDAGTTEISTEDKVDEYMARISEIGDELARVLKPTGSWWLNLGDSYSRGPRFGAPPKSLLLAPKRTLLVLAESGWICRNKVVWAKPNPMPASVADRLTCTWEPLYLLTRQGNYYFDLDAIRVPHRSKRHRRRRRPAAPRPRAAAPSWAGPLAGSNSGLERARAEGRPGHPLGKNPGDVWTVATAGFRGDHPAPFPTGLVERPLRATCPDRVCAICGEPWRRPRRRDRLASPQPSCDCDSASVPGLVLDPFVGSGTTAIVAERIGRHWLGIELSRRYAGLARRRITTARGTARDPPP